MENDSYKNLVSLLNLFKNRPYHLAKYLIDNSALSDKFIKDVLNNNKLSKISEEDSLTTNNYSKINFVTISQMEDFYASLIDDKDIIKKTPEELEKEMNIKLDKLIAEEKFEEAAYIRDLMKSKKIKRNSK